MTRVRVRMVSVEEEERKEDKIERERFDLGPLFHI